MAFNYEYECEDCGEIFEEIRPLDERNNPATCACGGVAHKIMSVNAKSIFWGQEIDVSNITGKKGQTVRTLDEWKKVAAKHDRQPISNAGSDVSYNNGI